MSDYIAQIAANWEVFLSAFFSRQTCFPRRVQGMTNAAASQTGRAARMFCGLSLDAAGKSRQKISSSSS